jgi:hypothetical protein
VPVDGCAAHARGFPVSWLDLYLLTLFVALIVLLVARFMY